MRNYILCLALSLAAGANPAAAIGQKGTVMAKHASGTFDVKIGPQPAEAHVGDPTIARMAIDKQYHGDLEATGFGQMLAGMGEVKDSGGYVAIERVRGTLHGRTGSFAVQHRGIMTRGAQDLVITVIPDSGTDALTGITGTMTIEIKDGKHYYGFDYTLP